MVSCEGCWKSNKSVKHMLTGCRRYRIFSLDVTEGEFVVLVGPSGCEIHCAAHDRRPGINLGRSDGAGSDKG